jgi:hypothetical protein
LQQIQALGSGLKTDKESVQRAVEKLSTNIQLAIHTIKASPNIKVIIIRDAPDIRPAG